jgi:hypothetical protein
MRLFHRFTILGKASPVIQHFGTLAVSAPIQIAPTVLRKPWNGETATDFSRKYRCLSVSPRFETALQQSAPSSVTSPRKVDRSTERQRRKALSTYTIEEVARSLEVHRNTVGHWIKAGLPVIEAKRPILILGSGLTEYLLRRREACAGRPCGADLLPEVPQASGADRLDRRFRRKLHHPGAPWSAYTPPAIVL